MKQSRAQGVRGGLALLVLALMGGAAIAQVSVPEPLRYSLDFRGQYTPQGLLIQLVTPGSEAQRAGLQRGDLVVKIDGQVVTTPAELTQVINTSGGSVVLTVRQPGGRLARINLDLRGGVRRGNIIAPYLLGVLGQYRPDGMLIEAVAPGTPASRAQLQRGDLILRVNNEFIRNQRHLFTVLNSSGGTVVLDVRRGKTGRVQRLTIDLRVYELGALGLFTPQGVRVQVVAPGTAAERVGLQPGDFITHIDGQLLRNQDDFDRALRSSGGSVVLVVRRGLGGLPVRLQVDLMNNPLGVWCESAPEGVRLTTVPPGTPARQIGLERGDVILKVDSQRVRTRDDLLQALKDSGGLVTLIIRKGFTGRLVRLDVALGW